jgi:hypothetical protein
MLVCVSRSSARLSAVSKRQTPHYHGIYTANTFQMLYFVCLIPRLWSDGQSFWLQIQRSEVRFLALPEFFWEVMGLERGPLSLVSTIEELLGRNSKGSGLENREYGRRDPSRWPRDNPSPRKLSLTLLTSGGRSVSIVSSRTDATEFVLYSQYSRWTFSGFNVALRKGTLRIVS